MQKLSYIYSFSFSVYGCLTCMYVCVAHVCLVPLGARRGGWNPGTGITDGWKAPYRCWESNLGFLEEWQMLLTGESALHSTECNLWHWFSWFSDWGVGLELYIESLGFPVCRCCITELIRVHKCVSQLPAALYVYTQIYHFLRYLEKAFVNSDGELQF